MKKEYYNRKSVIGDEYMKKDKNDIIMAIWFIVCFLLLIMSTLV